MTESVTTIPIEESSDIRLDPAEEQVLKDQVDVPKRKESYFALYRFATKLDWIIMFIGLVFTTFAGIAVPLMTTIFGVMVDNYTRFQTHTMGTDEFSGYVNHLALILLVVAIAIFVATYVAIATWVYTSERQNIAYFDKYGSGEVTTRITSDMHFIQDGIGEKVSLSFQYVVQFISCFIIAIIISWKMTLVMSYLIFLLVSASGLLSKYGAIFSKRISNFNSRAGIIAEEAISTIRTAVAFGAQKKLSKLYDACLDDARKEGLKKALMTGCVLGIMFLGIYTAYSLAFWFGSIMIGNHELTSGQVTNVFFAILVGSINLTNFFTDVQALTLAIGASSKIFEAIDRIPSIDTASDTGDKPKDVVGHIQLKNINFVYPTRPNVKTLSDISLDVEPGSTVALVGSSGSGKSTIVSLILRFYDPISGDVILDGHEIKSLNLTWLRRQIGLVSQEPILFSTSIAENVSYGLIGSIYENLPDNEKREMIENACKMANAHEFILNLPDKYETMVGQRGILLSGGQKQRIAIARAIIKDPKILLLDEATSALDTHSEDIVQNALDKASKGRTTIVIAHRLSTIRNATKIIVMNEGVIVESGTHNDLMDKKGCYSKLVEAQEIQQALKDEETLNILNSFINPTKDKITTSFTTKINGDNQLAHTSSNKSILSSRSIFIKKKSDVEMGLKHNKHNYTAWELFKKVAFINRPEMLLLSIGIITSAINAFTKTGETLHKEATFWALMFLVFAVMIFFANLIQNITLGISSENLTKRINSMSFASILRQDISFFDEENNSVGALASHLSLDVTHVKGLAGSTLGNILQVISTILASIVVSFIVEWRLTLVCLCCIPLLVGSGALRIKMLSGFQQKTKKAYENSAQIACEGADNIRTVAALTREDHLCEIYHNLLDEPMRQGFKNAYLASTIFAFANSVNVLVNSVTFWYGSRLFMANELDIGKMFTVYMAVMLGSTSAGRVFAHAPDMTKAKSASATIISLIERVPKIDTWRQDGEAVKTIKGHLKFSDVNFHYPTRPNVPVLQGLNLEVKPGQYAALVGPSGSGKSTTISLTERFYEVTSGTITIDEMDIDKMNVTNLREHIALVSQEPSLYNMTIKENIILGCLPGQDITQNDVEKACREANIHDFIVGLPDGYNTCVGGKGTQLSGGQKQRIAIARALIRNPKILLLDEATSALDSESEKVVQKALDAAARGRTTLAIAHRLSTIQHADVIFVIKDGKVHEQGTHQELLKLEGLYYTMVQRQLLGE
ncbi:4909_t:CDS:2 [Gigaspora margarita]|uniref:4909_t:CDS:1 n=1 Tax=Gigaspora margarita TaxID=4874 RepID=A0ABN7VNQ6_GIGMA|nr:4909_t:CDS:2 [Gigaspora margarita]